MTVALHLLGVLAVLVCIVGAMFVAFLIADWDHLPTLILSAVAGVLFGCVVLIGWGLFA